MTAAAIDNVLEDFEAALTAAEDELAHVRVPGHDFTEQLGKFRTLMNWLYDGGWLTWGWPEAVAGRGGSPIIRCAIMERLALRGYEIPYHLQSLEVVGPAVAKYAPALAAEVLPAALRGDEIWCQGFSEPEAGSDLASLRTRAIPQEDGSFVVTGQKIWTSYGPLGKRMLLLARTGPVTDRHRNLVMLLVDLDTPGIERRTISLASGSEELAEFFFTDVVVGADRLVGDVGGGWSVAMDLLQYERGAYAWMRAAMATSFLQQLIEGIEADSLAQDDHLANTIIGQTYLNIAVLRARTSATLQQLSDGKVVGPQTSVDKLLLSTAEQGVTDAAADLMDAAVLIGDSPGDERWRENWWYSRAASIYGGAREIQHGIIADKILKLPKEVTVK